MIARATRSTSRWEGIAAVAVALGDRAVHVVDHVLCAAAPAFTASRTDRLVFRAVARKEALALDFIDPEAVLVDGVNPSSRHPLLHPLKNAEHSRRHGLDDPPRGQQVSFR